MVVRPCLIDTGARSQRQRFYLLISITCIQFDIRLTYTQSKFYLFLRYLDFRRLRISQAALPRAEGVHGFALFTHARKLSVSTNVRPAGRRKRNGPASPYLQIEATDTDANSLASYRLNNGGPASASRYLPQRGLWNTIRLPATEPHRTASSFAVQALLTYR